MVVLCSDGLTSQNLINAMDQFTSQCKTAALVVTADNLYKEKNYHVQRCIEELGKLGLTTTIADIDMEDPCSLLNYDVVEFIGGNPFYLLDSIRKHNAEEVIQKIAHDNVLIGWSAAAFVFSLSLELANEYTPDMNTIPLYDLNGLGLVPAYILPHYKKFLSRFHHFEDRCHSYEMKKGVEVVRLNDGDGLIFVNGNKSIIRNNVKMQK